MGFLITSGRLSVPRARLMMLNWLTPLLPSTSLSEDLASEMISLWSMLGGVSGEVAQSFEPAHVSHQTGGIFN